MRQATGTLTIETLVAITDDVAAWVDGPYMREGHRRRPHRRPIALRLIGE